MQAIFRFLILGQLRYMAPGIGFGKEFPGLPGFPQEKYTVEFRVIELPYEAKVRISRKAAVEKVKSLAGMRRRRHLTQYDIRMVD